MDYSFVLFCCVEEIVLCLEFCEPFFSKFRSWLWLPQDCDTSKALLILYLFTALSYRSVILFCVSWKLIILKLTVYNIKWKQDKPQRFKGSKSISFLLLMKTMAGSKSRYDYFHSVGSFQIKFVGFERFNMK